MPTVHKLPPLRMRKSAPRYQAETDRAWFYLTELRDKGTEGRGQEGRSEEGAERSGRGKAPRLSAQMVGPPGLVHRRRSKTKYGSVPRSRDPPRSAGARPGRLRRAHGATRASQLTKGRSAGRHPAAPAANNQCSLSLEPSSGWG